jgi:hypothetical protein
MKHCIIRALRPFEGSIIFAHVETRCRADGLVEAVMTGQTELPIECATFAQAYSQFEVQVVDGAAPPLVPQGLRIAQPWHGMVPTVPTLDELVTSGVAEADAEAIRDHEARCAEAGLWPYGVNPPPAIWTEHLAQRDPPVEAPGEVFTPEPGEIADPVAYEAALAAGAIGEIPAGDLPAAAPAAEDGPKLDLPAAAPAPAAEPAAGVSHFEARRAELMRLAELPDRGGALREIVRNHNMTGVGNAKTEMIEAILAQEFPNG